MGFNYLSLNIQRKDGVWLCPSCGLPGYFDGSQFDEEKPLVGTGICPCCMYEPGYDDVAAASGVPEEVPVDALRGYSRRWRDEGMKWRGAISAKPKTWDPLRQRADWERLAREELR